MRCIYCQNRMYFESVWSEWLKCPGVVCRGCRAKFREIQAPVCQKCGRPYHEKWFDQTDVCKDCQALWAECERMGYAGNRSLFVYDAEGQKWMNQFKFRGDAVCIQMFRAEIQRMWKPLRRSTDLIVPIPLSARRGMERRFNQAERIADQMDRKKVCTTLLYRREQEKQSKLSRTDRLSRANGFYVAADCAPDVRGKRILLVDDIYTTGATIYRAAELLSAMRPKEIRSFTLFRA